MVDSSKHTLLIVDDNPVNLQVIVDFLHSEGFRVLTARSGQSALERARYGQPDLILLDVQMPEMDGFETCRRLKSDPQTGAIPVIFMTALSETDYKIKGFEVGAVDYIIKPFQYAEVLARVTTHLRIYELTHNLEQLAERRTAELARSLERERHLAQELERALDKERELGRLKTQILDVVSHEFRTPLSVITQSSSILQNFYPRLTAEKRLRNFKRINEAVFAIDGLLSDVALINVRNNADINLKYASIQFTDLCQKLKSMLVTKVAESDRVRFMVEASDALLATDQDKVERILLQLVSNGLKFSEAPQIVDVELGISDDDHLVIQVSDSGIGIPENEQDKIFDLFYRAKNVGVRRGLGVGLHIVAQLVERLGGTVEAESTIGQGSTFSLRLPCEADI